MLTGSVPRPTFGIAVGGVIGVSADEKMVVPNTDWVVTVMQNLLFVRYGTVRDGPRESVGLNLSFSSPELAVTQAVRKPAAGP